MKKALALAVPLVAVAGLVWARQDMGGKEQDQPQLPKPGKEHEAMKELEGTWDFVMKHRMAPDAPEVESKGVETCSMVGGFWMVFDIKVPAMVMGMPWHGHGIMGFDPAKKKYVGSFVHNMTPYLSTGEGTMDAAGKVLTMTWEGMDDRTGKVGKMREVFERKDKDHSVMTMYGPGPDGKETVYFTSTYTRKK